MLGAINVVRVMLDEFEMPITKSEESKLRSKKTTREKSRAFRICLIAFAF